VRFPRTRSERASRSLMGFLVAYAIALQAALSGFVAVSCLTSFASTPTGFCSKSGAEGGDGSGQGGHRGICPCGPACVMSMCTAGIGAPVASVARIAPTTARSSPLPRFDLEPTGLRPIGKGAHCPRAPPRPDVLAA
jgi:hypothetical protein